jgi:hypothetical protein
VTDLPAGTVTFLFTDIEGSTRLLHELGDDYAAAVAEHPAEWERVASSIDALVSDEQLAAARTEGARQSIEDALDTALKYLD